MNRRHFLRASAALVPLHLAAEEDSPSLRDRIAGLLYGSAIGDALGGPVEFQSREAVATLSHPPKQWQKGEVLDSKEAIARLRMRPYAPLRPASESYGQWGDPAPAGTITDDTRHKLVLLDALHQSKGALTTQGLAQTYLDWPKQGFDKARQAINEDWLEEWRYASAWELGQRDLSKARPPARLWQGLATCCGQMTSLPLAALYPGQPEKAYLKAYELNYFDNGFAKDLNAALVAGLATALAGEPWPAILASMRTTDPYHYGDIRYTMRQVDRWLDLALKLAQEANGEPAALFAALDKTFFETIKWEAQVPFVVTFASLTLANNDPLAALQLSIEWGEDTDSYASLVGAFIGAVHGVNLFPESLLAPVHARLVADFHANLAEEAQFLHNLSAKSE